MSAKLIQRLECNYDESVESTSWPDWNDIETAIRSLECKPGRIDLIESGGNGLAIMITANPGVYGVDVLVDDENAMMLMNDDATGETYVEMFGQDCRDNQVVHNLDVVVQAVKNLVTVGQYVDSPPYTWLHYNM